MLVLVQVPWIFFRLIWINFVRFLLFHSSLARHYVLVGCDALFVKIDMEYEEI